MSAADYRPLIGRLVVVYAGSGASGPYTLVSIEDGWFVLSSTSSPDRFTIRRRGTVLRPF
jgi:hypothetical protein